MNRRQFLKGISLATGGLAVGGGVNAWAAELISNKTLKAGVGGKKPNIIILLADDLGYSDLGCFSSPWVKSPCLDKLASEGLRLTACYSGAPMCSPSRASLLTGRNCTRASIYSYIPTDQPAGQEHPMHLRTTEITIATILKQAGYQTGHWGKWHLNTTTNPAFGQPEPNDHGFDYWFAVTNQAMTNGVLHYKDPDNFCRNGTPVGPLTGYPAELVVNDTIDWLENQRDKTKPFFLHIGFCEPHNPILPADELPPDLMALYNPLPINDLNKRYYATISNMDRHIGRLLDRLDKLHLRENTLVVLLSDNGPNEDKGPDSKIPLRGYKTYIYEGGLRTPGIMRWPGHTKPGSECDEPLAFVDFAPTLAELAGATMPTDRVIDGTNFLPVLECKSIVRKTPLFWHFYREVPQVAMRQGDWVLVGRRSYPFPDDSVNPLHHQFRLCHMKYIKMENDSYNGFNFQNTVWESFELYNIKQDMGQRKDLSISEPKRFGEMKQKMMAMYNSVVNEGYRWPDAGFVPPWNDCP